MALQQFPNKQGVLLFPHFNMMESASSGSTTLDAAGESKSIIGKIHLEGGSGSKTISSSGGKIHWKVGSATFANAGTNLRIGVQDVAATGLEDGTFDVQADLVGGTDTITANSLMSTAMESGTKTISHGDLIAVVLEMTARGGADSIGVVNMSSSIGIMPYSTVDIGTLSKSATLPLITIEFDDGTVGWFNPFYAVPGSAIVGTIATSYNSGSTPDERALIFQLPFKATIGTLLAGISPGTSSADYELVLYSDPLGTPVVEATVTIDADFTSLVSQAYILGRLSSDFTLQANTNYAISVRPTTANSISLFEYTFGATNLMKPTALGTNWYSGTRTNQTGAFSTTTTTIPLIGFWLTQFDDGASAGGLKTHPGMSGGMRG